MAAQCPASCNEVRDAIDDSRKDIGFPPIEEDDEQQE
jgi:hypothetical protein